MRSHVNVTAMYGQVVLGVVLVVAFYGSLPTSLLVTRMIWYLVLSLGLNVAVTTLRTRGRSHP